MNYISDPHPRVRFACCNAIGQMSTRVGIFRVDSAVVSNGRDSLRIPGMLEMHMRHSCEDSGRFSEVRFWEESLCCRKATWIRFLEKSWQLIINSQLIRLR